MAESIQRRSDAELKNPEYNYFVAFKVELNEKDKGKIEAKIKTVTGSPKGDILTRRLIELKTDAIEVMCNDAVFNDETGKYVPNSGGRAKEAARAKQYKLDEAVNLIGILCQNRKTLLKSDIIDICNTANKPITFFSEDELFKAISNLTGMGVKIVDNIDASIPFSDYQQTEKKLDSLGKKDLYDFLGVSNTASKSDIQAASDKIYGESNKTNDLKRKQLISQLCATVKKLILDSEQSRQTYNQYLILKKDVWEKFALIKSYGIKEITTEEYEKYTQTAVNLLNVELAEAQKIIGVGCKYFQFNIVGESSSGALETCAFCGALIPKGAKSCKHCGKQLETTCWNCKQSIRATPGDRPCPVCGATNYAKDLLNQRCKDIDRLLAEKHTKLPELEAALVDLKEVLPNYEKRVNSTVATKVKEYNIRMEPKRNLAKVEEKRAKKKKKKKAAIISGVSVSSFVLAVFLFVLFTFLIPLWSMLVTTTSSNNEYTVTGLKPRARNTTVLEIGETVPKLFFQKQKTVVGIGAGAFSGNTVLQKVTLPKTINRIGAMAFANCSALTTVIINSNEPPLVAENAFNGTDAMLYVPENSYENYLVADGWRNYNENIFPYVEGVDDEHGVLVYLAEYGLFENGRNYYLFPAYGFGATLPTVNAPTRPGYNFEGWCYKKNGVVNVGSSTYFNRSMKLHAKWSPNPYTITYKYGDDVTMPSNVPTTYNIEQEVELPIPSRVGYVFDGWCTNAELTGTVYKTTIPVGTTGNLTLYPKWTEAVYNFKFVSIGVQIDEIMLKTGDIIDVVPPRPSSGEFSSGYVFVGWSLVEGSDLNGSSDIFTEVPPMEDTTQTITLYAVWKKVDDNWYLFEKQDSGWYYIAGLNEAWYNYPGDEKVYLYLPNNYSGMQIVGIKEGAFAGNTKIKSVDIPSSFTDIGEKAFFNCNNLGYVLNGSGIYDIGKDAFRGTNWLDTKWNKSYNKSWFLSLGHVALKYNYHRDNAMNLTENDFPSDIKVLGYGLFEGCGAGSSGGTVVIPDSIWRICDRAFANSGFTNFTLSTDITYGETVFAGISRIGTLTLKNTSSGTVTINFADVFQDALDDGITIDTLTFTGHLGGSLYISGGGVTVKKFAGSGVGLNGVSTGLKFTGATLEDFAKITELDLSYNAITSFQANGFPIGTLNLRNNSLYGLNITTLFATKLILANNVIMNITCTEINEYVAVIYMPTPSSEDGYCNMISNLKFAAYLPNLMSLDVANNSINDINGLFGLTKLKELYLGGNPVLNDVYQVQINNLSDAAFCPNLVRLNLGGGNSRYSILRVVANCPNLEWLQIYGIGASETEITNTISQATHPKLKYLKISHNGITRVPDSLNYISTVVVDYEDNRQEDERR